MIKFVTFLSVFSVLICTSNCVAFCDVKTMDNVFNIGHYVYITRCGEVWTFNPYMTEEQDGNYSGGFLRDYFWQATVRGMLAQEHHENSPNYLPEDLHFAAFSFQELACDDPWYDMQRVCDYAAHLWNGWSVIAGNWSIHSFRYLDGIYLNFSDEYNPIGLPSEQQYFTQKRDKFWPHIAILAPQFNFPRFESSKDPTVNEFNDAGRIHSALFFKEEYRLFIGMRSIDGKYFCITHLYMRSMITDVRLFPKKLSPKPGRKPTFNWAPAYCFTGNLVGMFSLEGRAYAVGRIIDADYEDQVYSMNAVDGSPVILQSVLIPNYFHPYNLRTFFGCDSPKKLTKFTEPPGPPTTCIFRVIPGGAGRPIHGSRECSRVQLDRKKRSIDEIQTMIQSIWDDMKREVRDDWILLSLMSFVALFMIFIIYRLKKK